LKCTDSDCVCNGTGDLIWVLDLYRWSYQLLCNKGGLIFMEIEGDIEIYDYIGDTYGLKGNPAVDTPPLPTADDYIRCANCNRLTLKTGRHQKFCPMCTALIRRIQKREWIRERRRLSNDNGSNGHNLGSEHQ